MNTIIEELRVWGCDIDGAMGRLLDDENLYLMLLNKVPGDPAFAALGEYLLQGDAKNGFEQAHSLKGLLGNMGLTPLYTIVGEIVEPLRLGNTEGLMPSYGQLMAEHERLCEIIKKG